MLFAPSAPTRTLASLSPESVSTRTVLLRDVPDGYTQRHIHVGVAPDELQVRLVEGFTVDRPAQGLIGLEVSKVLGTVGEVRSLHGALHQVPEGFRNVRPRLERDPSGARLPPETHPCQLVLMQLEECKNHLVLMKKRH